MRGRKPRELSIDAEDCPVLEQIARSQTRPWFQVERARILLAIATGQRVQEVVGQKQYGRTTIWRICRRYEQHGLEGVLSMEPRTGHPSRFPPLQQAQIVELACMEPIATGLHITHWTSEDLARQAVAEGIVSAISPRTVRQILHNVVLQPHRTRYWKTSHLDAEFKARTEKILWAYGNAERLVAEGIWVVCVDEMPNLQVLERHPIRRAKPGLIEHQEFEYTRHGTVNVVMLLVVHTGRMEAFCLDNKSAHNYTRLLQSFRQRHHHLKGIFLIQDNDPTHIAQWTTDDFAASEGWWRPRFTPVHASWLNQAELLNQAFGYHYLKRRSFKSRREYIDHVNVSWPEYNRRYAHPIEWTWTNHKMRKWYAEHNS